MPLFMDIHEKVEGAKAADVAEAHLKDLEVQSKYGVKYLRYWLDESTGKIFVSLTRRIKTPLCASTVRRTASSPIRSMR